MMRIALLTLLLTGCAGAYSPVNGGSENTVTVSWARVGMAGALESAEAHCAKFGRHAQFAGKQDFWLFYNCVKP